MHLKYNLDVCRMILTVFMYLGADPEETILNAFKVFDPEGKGVLRKD